ncbi:hypothetical protein TOK_0771 [Pseudonocardia sp. N23]|nr:hypothetical protein TOK_0771 [Pseudonocardia sp. N23]
MYIIAGSVGSGMAAGYGAGRARRARRRRGTTAPRTMRAWPGPDGHVRRSGSGEVRPRRGRGRRVGRG